MRKIFVWNEVSDTDKTIHRSNGFQFIVHGSPYVGAHARMTFRAANGAFAIAMRQSRRGCDTLHASASHSFESKRVGSFVPSRDKRPRFFQLSIGKSSILANGEVWVTDDPRAEFSSMNRVFFFSSFIFFLSSKRFKIILRWLIWTFYFRTRFFF